MKILLPLSLLLIVQSIFAEWPQGAGKFGNFSADEAFPVSWSVVNDEDIAWKLTLPETGQSTPVVLNGKVFFTTLKPVQ